MFQVGEYVVYGSNGVCKVDKIGTINVDGISKERVYYTLVPIYMTGSKVFTPVDNQKVIMRPLISKQEALNLLDNVEDIEMLWIPEEKKREEIYKEALKTCSCRDWIRIIKTLYMRKQSRLAKGKKVTSNDEKYLHIAEDNLFGEFAVTFEIEKEQVEEFIANKIESKNN